MYQYIGPGNTIAPGNAVALGNIGGFSTVEYYWSSTEYDGLTAWIQSFYISGGQASTTKNSDHFVRAVRAF